MISLKSSAQLQAIFKKTIQVMGARVEWNGMFIVHKNNIILPGKVKSLIFSLESRKIVGTVVELDEIKSKDLYQVKDKIIENAFNMLLYIFGKWDQIKGLTVEKNYSQLEQMIRSVLSEIDVDAEFTKNHCNFYRNSVQITYEDVIDSFIQLLEPEKMEELEHGEDDYNEEDEDDRGGRNQESLDNDNETGAAGLGENGISDGNSERDNWFARKYKIGLWHKIVWSSVDLNFKKEHIPADRAKKERLGKDYYLSNYRCPECNSFLHMVVYPVTNEFMIDTDEGEVLLARAYTCSKCTRFYTPRPRRMLIEGAVYMMDFEHDQTAYEDYLELTGENGERTSNCNFNEYVRVIEEMERNIGKKKGKKPGQPVRDEITQNDQDRIEEMLENPEHFTDQELIMVKEQMDSMYYPRSVAAQYDEQVTKHLVDRGITELSSENKHIKKLKKDKKARGSFSEIISNMAEKHTLSKRKAEKAKSGKQQPKNSESEKSKPEQSNIENSKSEQSNPEQSKPEKRMDEKSKDNEFMHEKTTTDRTVLETNDSDKSGSVKRRTKDLISDQYEMVESKNSVRLVEERVSETAEHPKVPNLDPEQLSYMVEQSEDAPFDEMNKLYYTIEHQEMAEKEKRGLLQKLGFKRKQRARKELTIIGDHLPDQLGKKQYVKISDQIDQYHSDIAEFEPENLVEVKNKLEQKRKDQEQRELNEYMGKVNKRTSDRAFLLNAYNNLKELGDYDKETKAPFLKQIHDRIRHIDEAVIKKICPDIFNMSFKEGKEAQKQITESDILPELKVDVLGSIDRRLSLMKKDECEQLSQKFKKESGWNQQEYQGIYFFDHRNMKLEEHNDWNEDEDDSQRTLYDDDQDRGQNEGWDENPDDGQDNSRDENHKDVQEQEQEQNVSADENLNDEHVFDYAIHNIAGELDRYEYPIFFCDMTRNQTAKNGFILTPEHLYYSFLLNRGVLNVENIEELYQNSSILSKGIYADYQKVGKVKVSGPLKDAQMKSEHIESFLSSLNEFISYLKEKPESRNIGYMAKEQHTVKCCYRCGFVFKEGEFCPRCGAHNK